MKLFYVILFLFVTKKAKGLYNPNYPFLIINANRSLVTELTTETKDRRTYKYYATAETPPVTRKIEHVPSVIDKTCLLKPEVGPCRAKVPMYFFDPATQNCSVFEWGGCQGNGNRFDRLADCLSTCLSSPGLNPRRPRYCQLTFDYGWCFGAEERWYYDFRYKACKRTIYSGCGGNKNNFYNKEQCDTLCRFGLIALESGVTRPKNTIKKVMIVDPPNGKTKRASAASEATPSGRKGFEQLSKEHEDFIHIIPNARDMHHTADLHAHDDNSLEEVQKRGWD